MSNPALLSYAVYILLSVVITIWVGQTLFKRGRIFVLESFNGRAEMADSVNHLLIVGFYLVNIGFVALFLRFGETPINAVEVVEYISGKIGIVLLVLGGMHYFNIWNIAKMRRKALGKQSTSSTEENVASTLITKNKGLAAK